MEEEQARKAARACPDRVAARWIEELLHERRADIAMAQQLARQLHHLQARLRAAAEYFDRVRADAGGWRDAAPRAWKHLAGLVAAAYQVTCRRWPRRLPCAVCGAPGILYRVEMLPSPDGPRPVGGGPTR